MKSSFRVRSITCFRSEHDLHMTEGHRNALWVQNIFMKDFIEMRSDDNFRTIRASVQQMEDYATEQASTICR
jgi:hypothetical protein